ncbi:GLIPR1-like protein 1 [Puntigrus tetrazona]|uniref:GLIPR1-like protein 1 n=1 Tax=Puntigrus tetrazona TaxID=1606681 RepID=UPI001C898008|nr:GLIPR1-like protein 1 [Puntigrus tetrazona]
MRDRLQLLLCISVLLGSGLGSCDPVFDIKDPAFIEECVREHNKHRSGVKPTAAAMRYMSWDEGLAVTARAWARFCVFKHNIYIRDVKRMHPTFTSVGENLWTGELYSSFKPESAVKMWKDEDVHYSLDANACTAGKVCGHYTQIVWADSYKVGCAAQACPNGVAHFTTRPGVIFVCNYATAGNYAGVSPYKAGVSCSGCGGDRCQDQLCRNPDRDAPQSYNWTPDWDPALSSCNSFCVAVVVIRLVSIPLMFACVYCLRRHYNLFAYE